MALVSKSEKIYHRNVAVKIAAVHDGDTFAGNISRWPSVVGKGVLIRLYGIDAPELTDHRFEVATIARKARSRLEELMTGGPIILSTVRRDKYFRLLCEIECHGLDIGKTLIEEGLAKPYSGEDARPW